MLLAESFSVRYLNKPAEMRMRSSPIKRLSMYRQKISKSITTWVPLSWAWALRGGGKLYASNKNKARLY
jgi:hypothetical protein